jgi:phage protein D
MAKHKYNDLQKKYNGYMAPTCTVVINKSDKLSKEEPSLIKSAEVELTAGYEASACHIVINKGITVDVAKNDIVFNQAIKDLVKLGQPISVSLGYLDEQQAVFQGIITNIQLEYEADTGIEMHIEGMDVKCLMMNNYHSCQPRKDLKKYSDAFKEVVKKYAKLISKQTIADTDEMVLAIEQHNQSDYEFLVSIARKCNHAFYINNGELLFEPYGKDSSPCIELDIQELQQFRREISLSNQIAEVTVRANNETDPNKSFEFTAKTFKAIGKGKKGSIDLMSSLKEMAKMTIVDPSISSAKEAKARAEAELFKHSMKFSQGSFQTVGIPEIIPAKLMTIKGFGNDYNNDYYIKKVTHIMNEEGYITKGELGVNKV